jgi:D-alanyl-D-alanine carboxypeptidase
VGLLFLMLPLDSAPTSTTVAASTSTTLATTSMSSSTVTTTPASTATTETTAPQPVFQSSIGLIDAAEVSSSWHEGCPLDVESLRAVDVSHFGYDGEVHSGRLVVAEEVAEDMVGIMSRLFEAGFPIERMEPVDVYGGDDDLSMAANNTSAFNCRPVTGGSSWSEHSYGRAIDVNPLVNPYVVGRTVLPPEGAAYADRSLDAPGMIHDGDLVVEAFAAHGWIWGGTWSSPKDYQHFSTSGR